MGIARRVALAVALLVPGALLCRPALPADAPAGDEAAFLAALDQAKGMLASGRAGEGQRLLAEALAQHERRDYAFGKRAEIEDLARRLAFRAECTPPDPQDMVKGKLARFVARTGDMEIRYQAGKPTDFQVRGEEMVFPARFRGPFTLTIKGDAYPDGTTQVPIVQVGMEESAKTGKVQAWAMTFGVPAREEGGRKVWIPARVLYLDGTEKKMLVEKPSPAVVGKPYRIDISVTPTRVTGTLNGTSIGSAPKPEGVFGGVMMIAPAWREIAIAGQVEPSWIQSKIDAIVDEQRKKFEAKFQLKGVLPGWLYEARPAAPGGPKTTPAAVALPKGLPAALVAEYQAALLRILAEDYEGALAAAKALRTKGAPDSATGLLAARAHLGLDEPQEALDAVGRAITCDAESVAAHLVRGEALLTLGREDEGVAALRAATACPQAGGDAFEEAGAQLLLAGRLDDARTVTEAAARRGLRTPGLDALSRAVVGAQNGPNWPRVQEVKSANYHVVSDLDAATCREASQVLESALIEYRVHVRPLKPTDKRRTYKVFLFSGEAGFRSYLSDAAAPKGGGQVRVAGVYSPVLKQLLIWNLPNRDEMFRTIRHEGFHQYLDRLLLDPPLWFNEGLAEYFEVMQTKGSSLGTEKPRADHMETLGAGPLVPLDEFLYWTPKRFYAAAPRSYAQAWLLVHMLRHGEPKHRELYRRLLAELETKPGAAAVALVFDEKALSGLDGDLQAYRVALAGKK